MIYPPVPVRGHVTHGYYYKTGEMTDLKILLLLRLLAAVSGTQSAQ